MRVAFFSINILVGLACVSSVFAQEGATESPPAEVQGLSEAETPTSETPASEVPVQVPRKSKKARGNIKREKEAEGTKAPNRFDSEAIIKSRYELNGKFLEVDTD